MGRRLLAAGAILSAVAILISTEVWGGARYQDKDLQEWRKGDGKNIKPASDDGSGEDADRNRFNETPVVTYKQGEETLFALQVQPRLPDSPALPRDYLVVIDTSASKAMGPLNMAQQIVQDLARMLPPQDRMAIWTANIKPRDISRGFKPGNALEETFKELAKEIPLGAVNLKLCLGDALASFEVKSDRQRVLLFLGDGKSVADPLDAESRSELCDTMVKKQVGFFPVPLGTRIDSQNLHTLVAGTGGKVIRPGTSEPTTALIVRMQKEIGEPILYPDQFKLLGGKDLLPSRMPPLRRDTGTLVVGKLNADAKSLDLSMNGKLFDKDLEQQASYKLPPTDTDNFFLTSIYDQWKNQKDRPALLSSDRALSFAYKQNQLAVEDLLAKAEMCLEDNQTDAAEKLFEQVKQLSPTNPDAKGGLLLVDKIRTGKKTRQEILQELRINAGKREVVRLEKGGRKTVVMAQGEEKKEKEPNPEPGIDPVEDIKMRRQIADQQTTAQVN
ncbi:MAG: hypothetical protein ACKO23_13625, partial [Gemmataceae bacterium]